jgi:tetratricopeptide (TPR) repeat protein
MFRIFSALTALLFVLSACNNDDTTDNTVLSQPPFDKLTDSISQQPKNSDLYYRRGGLLYSNNQMDLAENDLRKAWQLDPKEEYALSVITVLKQKNTDSAIAFLQEALKKLPGSISLKVGLARGYQQKQQWDKALAICDTVISHYPNQLDALILKSEVLKAQNKNAESLATMEKAYSYAPFDKDLSYDLAYDYADAKNAKAISLSDSLIKKDSSETVARAYYIKATYFSNIGNNDEAIKNYDASIAHDYNFLDSYRDKGQLLYNQKKYDAALKTFQLALKVSPATAEFYFWMGKTQEAMGNKEEAKLNYQRAYGLDKTMTEAKEAANKIGT